VERDFWYPRTLIDSMKLLWKQVEATSSRSQHEEAEAWCGLCLHSLFSLAGEINKSKIARFFFRILNVRFGTDSCQEDDYVRSGTT
jgi:hypothetical protein